MAWTVELDPSVEKELAKLDPQQAKRILRFLFERIAHLEDPRSLGEALKRGLNSNLSGNTVLEIIVSLAVLRIMLSKFLL